MIIFYGPVVQCQSNLVVEIMTDDFPGETSWELLDGNTLTLVSSSEPLEANTIYRDTISIESYPCVQFEIRDTGGDGFDSEGFYKLYVDGALSKRGSNFGDAERHLIGCERGQNCYDPLRLTPGRRNLKEVTSIWYSYEPVADKYFDIYTVSDCDTKLWIYNDCDGVHPTDQTGAIAFSDDVDQKNAALRSILLEREKRYLVRLDIDPSCQEEVLFQVSDLNLKRGCMDPLSCNYDPFATIDSEDCIYEDCAPDLTVNAQTLRESLHLDSLISDNDCLIAEGCLLGTGRRDIIRFSTQIENIGDADFIIGAPEEDSHLFSEDNCHNHWHYLGYAEYLLYDNQGSSQPIGFKNGFCALDLRCASDLSYKYNCDYMGISAGCYDIYRSDLICQWIDITDVPDGQYILVVRVNHYQSSDILGRIESDFDNNFAQICLDISRSTGRLLAEVIEDCDVYTDCNDIPFGNTSLDCNNVCGGPALFGDANLDGQVDQIDFVTYRDLMSNPTSDACYDLDGDGMISVYDMTLLHDCISAGASEEEKRSHIACDFPRSTTDETTEIEWFMMDYLEESRGINLGYISTSDVRAFDLAFDGIDILSVTLMHEDDAVKVHHTSDRLYAYNFEATLLPKTTDTILFAQLTISDNHRPQGCMTDVYNTVNNQSEIIPSSMSKPCVALDVSTSTDEPLLGDLIVWPNPAALELYVTTKFTSSITSVSIYSVAGNKAYSPSLDGSMIDISELPQGVYFLEIKLEQESVLHKFVKM